MARFADVEAEEPAFAVRVRAASDAHAHKTLDTLRADGSPRISGIEMQFVAGEPWLAGMPRSVTPPTCGAITPSPCAAAAPNPAPSTATRS